MLIQNLFTTFDGDSFKTKELPKNFSFETDFPRSTADGLFTILSQKDIDTTDGLGSPPIEYLLGDTLSEPQFRNIHPVIVTDTRIQTTGKVVNILVRPRLGPLDNLELLLRRDPKMIARVIKKIEETYVKYLPTERLVFTNHPNWSNNLHGLAERLGALGVVDRP